MFTEYQIIFRDRSTTLLWVGEDETMQDAISTVCDTNDWDINEIVAVVRTGKTLP